MSEIRQQHLNPVRTAVIKLGTQLLSDKDGRLDANYVGTVAKQVAALRERGVRVTIVSSGAIGAGLRELNLPTRPTDLARLQACSGEVRDRGREEVLAVVELQDVRSARRRSQHVLPGGIDRKRTLHLAAHRISAQQRSV